MSFKKLLLFVFVITVQLLTVESYGGVRDYIDLSGDWYYRLHKAPVNIPAEGHLTLPGTLDTNKIGIPVAEGDHTSKLSRYFTFEGEVSFIKTINIPESWEGRDITLILERTRPSLIVIDGDTVSSSARISSSQKHNLTGHLTPGRHEIEIIVNNGDAIPGPVRRNSNQCSEYTQTNWNGILGDIKLEASGPTRLIDVKVIPDFHSGCYNVTATYSDPLFNADKIKVYFDGMEQEPIKIERTPQIFEEEDSDEDLPEGETLIAEEEESSEEEITSDDEAPTSGDEKITEEVEPDGEPFYPTQDVVTFTIPIGKNEKKWSEWTPELSEFRFVLATEDDLPLDEITVSSGLRSIVPLGSTFQINNSPMFLRGRTDSCVFPATGYAPTDKESWKRYFAILKDYGINHVRFHTWCPPEAAFEAADEAGFYLQPELPIWGELDRDNRKLIEFLYEDLNGILEDYSSHPSFSFFSVGNELWGDISLMQEYVDMAREYNPGLLVTSGSNVYLGLKGALDGDDYLLAAQIGEPDNKDGRTRGSYSFADASDGGMINSEYPNSSSDFLSAVKLMDVPLVSFETGQYQSYPDFSIIEKFDGVLRPDNFEEFKRRAIDAGTYPKNEKYNQASGKWASLLYKKEMEAALRTPGLGGFQLLDLQDYPGQGTALVGMLDLFMDSKGYLTPEEWRQSCDEVTLLAELPKYCFLEGEIVEIPVKVANFSDRLNISERLEWSTEFDSGSFRFPTAKGLSEAGSITLQMPSSEKPAKYTLNLNTDSEKYQNIYEFYVYPKANHQKDKVTVTTSPEDAFSILDRGGTVILFPDSSLVAQASKGPLFQTDFWNYRMYRTLCDKLEATPSPGTLGLLIDPRHPALSLFPSDFHTDNQWYAIVSNSYPLIIDRLPREVDPVIEVIDNIEQNYKLALVLECNVGKGKLIIVAADLDKISEYPEGRWFIYSLRNYAKSKEFKPEITLTEEQVTNLLTKPSNTRLIKELRNETYDSRWD